MKIDTQKVGTVDVLSPIGALVEDDAEDFCGKLMARLTSPDVRLVVSLQEVPYLDSIALEGLLAATDELAGQAAALKLTNVSPTCREILELTGVSNRFRFFQEIRDAVKSFL